MQLHVRQTVAPWVKRTRLRLQIWALGILQRATTSGLFKRTLLLTPFRYAMVVWVAWILHRIIRDPESFAEGPLADVATAARDLNATLDARPARDTTESSRTTGLAMTWGAGGIAVALLSALVALHSTAVWGLVSAACLALSIPLFTVSGIVLLSHTDLKTEAPTRRESLRLMLIMVAAYSLLFVGFAALMWGFSPYVCMAFLFGCWWAWDYLAKRGKPNSNADTNVS